MKLSNDTLPVLISGDYNYSVITNGGTATLKYKTKEMSNYLSVEPTASEDTASVLSLPVCQVKATLTGSAEAYLLRMTHKY
tara:strand:- start:10421 stop:10663 length:243 start_codon:yes stop_codon:yes gene_type:complete